MDYDLALRSTYKSLPELLQLSKPQIQQYFAMTEAQFGPLWIKRYIFFLHDLPQHKDELLYQALKDSPHKTSANYVASIIIAYLWKDDVLSNRYEGYQRLETAFRNTDVIRIKYQGKKFKFNMRE